MMNNSSSNDVNEILTTVTLIRRLYPRLHINSRETIRKTQLLQIKQSLSIALHTMKDYCQKTIILTPIMEVIGLIETLVADGTFVETDAETKSLIIERIDSAYVQLCLFAGEFYTKHDFTWNVQKDEILRDIVYTCLDMGYYFGYDKKLMEEGLI